MSQYQPPITPEPTGQRCIRCGYDLSGSVVGGTCPECGTPVAYSLSANAGAGGATTSGKATTSMVLGIIALVFLGCCPLSIVLGILAVVFGNGAKKEIADGLASPASAGTATAGIVCGWIAIGLAGLIILGYGFMMLVSVAAG